MRGHTAAVRTLSGTVSAALSTGVLVRGNVLVESYDTSTVVVGGHHGLVEANLALGTTKDMTGQSDSSQRGKHLPCKCLLRVGLRHQTSQAHTASLYINELGGSAVHVLWRQLCCCACRPVKF